MLLHCMKSVLIEFRWSLLENELKVSVPQTIKEPKNTSQTPSPPLFWIGHAKKLLLYIIKLYHKEVRDKKPFTDHYLFPSLK